LYGLQTWQADKLLYPTSQTVSSRPFDFIHSDV
jgi:hypothetical protein